MFVVVGRRTLLYLNGFQIVFQVGIGLDCWKSDASLGGEFRET